MTTPNSSAAQMVDIHADPDFAEQFGTNVGEKILEATPTAEFAAPVQSTRRCNVGRTEQKIRLIGGAALVAAAAVAPLNRNLRIGLAVLGVAELVTGSMRYCPLWQSLGINTARDVER